jgi:hypothetical protein
VWVLPDAAKPTDTMRTGIAGRVTGTYGAAVSVLTIELVSRKTHNRTVVVIGASG